MRGHTVSSDAGELRDQLSIETPELVELRFPLAGLGSRFLAVALDYLIQGIALLAVILLAVLFFPAAFRHAAPGSAKWAIAILILLLFLLHWGYFTLFEAFWNGQTPGKRMVKIRVIQQTGRSVGLFESIARNLLRVIDALPSFYLAGAITIVATDRQQRLGDLVAGTLVVHEAKVESPPGSATATRLITAGVFERAPQTPARRNGKIPADRIARLSIGDLQLIDSFLARRLELPFATASALAAKLAASLEAKMGTGRPEGMSDETFLEELASGLREVKL